MILYSKQLFRIQIFDIKLRCLLTLIIVLVFLEEEEVESDDNKNLKPNLKNDTGAAFARNDNNRRSSRKMKNAPRTKHKATRTSSDASKNSKG